MQFWVGNKCIVCVDERAFWRSICKLCKIETGICKTKEGVANNSKDGPMDPVKMEVMHS